MAGTQNPLEAGLYSLSWQFTALLIGPEMYQPGVSTIGTVAQAVSDIYGVVQFS